MVNSFNKVFLGAAGGEDLPSDDQFNRVSFLSHFEGANNGVNNAFDDGSTSNHTITANGNSTQGSFGPFSRPDGEFSVDFDGDGDSLTFTNDATMSLDGDYTFELFFNARTIVVDSQQPAVFASATTQLYIHSSDRYISWFGPINGSSSGNIVHSASNSILTNVWNHVAIVRSGTGSNNTSMYLNGTRVQQYQNTQTLGAGSGTARIGSYSAAGGNFDGQISNLRILKGTALYSGSSITVPTAPLTAVTNTKLLTCQSNRFVDNSSTGFGITPIGEAGVTAFGPFLTSAVYDPANGASASFDGSGDYLSIPYNTDFNFGTGSLTIECFIYPRDLSGGQGIYSTSGGSGSNPKFLWYFDTSTLKAHVNSLGSGSKFFNATTSPRIGEWTHIAFVRNGSTWYWFINGIQSGTGSDSTNITFSNLATNVGYGGEDASGPVNAFISNFRVVKGTAVYTSNFTPPTAPLTAITNTKLLLNMADGQAIDSAAQNNLTLYGNANTSTDQAKFGNTSLHLDGTGDYVKVLPSRNGNIYNYTVEQWLYPTRNYSGGGHFDRIWASGSSLNNSVMLHLDNTTAPKIVLRKDDNVIWTSSVSISLNAWTHVAVSCDVNGTRLYIAGTERATTGTVVNLKNLTFNIGTSTTGDGFFQGYIDDFRISHMARYTSNFTAPTEPFADKGR